MNWGIERSEQGFHITDDSDFSDVALVYELKDAKLISAAPELLEALQNCVSRLNLAIDQDRHKLLDIVARDAAQSAIKKALGE